MTTPFTSYFQQIVGSAGVFAVPASRVQCVVHVLSLRSLLFLCACAEDDRLFLQICHSVRAAERDCRDCGSLRHERCSVLQCQVCARHDAALVHVVG